MAHKPDAMARAESELRAAASALLHVVALFDAIAVGAGMGKPVIDAQSLAEIGRELAMTYSERFTSEAEWFEEARHA
ncbi:hypothetical protein [Pandoraea commovens]|uniref:Uncharacterized protein n=1 Tax=Pandoraea commovens TaxID=2508289 RepID=A0ABY5QFN1_9BURK|nr:hypothetical protein [Pandoraea commovens]UVA79409.1 hypothetical protein NTU39_26070 [Pandoraea commovens]